MNARVEQGIIDYSGHQGSVQLFAGWEINLKFPLQTYTGGVDATAEGPVRALIPEGFGTGFEADVVHNPAFVCRTDMASQIKPREHGGRRIYTFGQGAPAIRLVSKRGPIVIDNTTA